MSILKPLDTLKTRRECALKLLEEASEACEAIKKHDKMQEFWSYQDALLELADVAQCMCNCLHALNPTKREWEDAVHTVQERNAERGRREIYTELALTVDWCDHD